MPLADLLRLGAQLPFGFEWIILLIIIAILLLFGPKKLPELARSIGRAWGELRRGKMEVERQIRDEFTAEERRDSGSRLREAARVLGVDASNMRDGDLKLQIVRKIDLVSDDQVASVARILDVSEGGASPSRLRELIVKSFGI